MPNLFPLIIDMLALCFHKSVAYWHIFRPISKTCQKIFLPIGDYHVIFEPQISLRPVITSIRGCYRTAINSASGVRTPAGGIWTGLTVLLALGVLTPYFTYIPQTALAAVIICAVVPMVEYELVPRLFKVKSKCWHFQRVGLLVLYVWLIWKNYFCHHLIYNVMQIFLACLNVLYLVDVM